MNIPFIYGKIADKENFTDRVTEQELLYQSFFSLVNTVIISPRRWGKTSLVNQVVQRFEKDKSIMICQIDIFNCRTEEEFYKAYANAVLRASSTAWDDFLASARKYLGRLLPTVTLTDLTTTESTDLATHHHHSNSGDHKPGFSRHHRTTEPVVFKHYRRTNSETNKLSDSHSQRSN